MWHEDYVILFFAFEEKKEEIYTQIKHISKRAHFLYSSFYLVKYMAMEEKNRKEKKLYTIKHAFIIADLCRPKL